MMDLSLRLPVLLVTILVALAGLYLTMRYPRFFFRSAVERQMSGWILLDLCGLLLIGSLLYMCVFESLKNLGLAILPRARPVAIVINAEEVQLRSRSDYFLSVAYVPAARLDELRTELPKYRHLPQKMERMLGAVYRLPVDLRAYRRYGFGDQVPIVHVPGLPYLAQVEGSSLPGRQFGLGFLLPLMVLVIGPVLFETLARFMPMQGKAPHATLLEVDE